MDVWKEMYLSLMRDTETTIRALEKIKAKFEKICEEEREGVLPCCTAMSQIYLASLELVTISLVNAQQKCENIYLDSGESPGEPADT